MEDIDSRLNALLSDPEAMGRIMALAQQLSGESAASSPPPSPEPPPSSQQEDDGFDPMLLLKFLPLLQELRQDNSSQSMQFLSAMRPFLKPERQPPDAHEIAKRRNVLVKQRESQYGKPYGIGLLMGVFDLFHVGHLRLINRAKARCRFLRVAVLADNVVQQFKGITPTIPLAQRMEILSAIDEVDEVVAIHDDPSRIKEYERRPFDCFFSGDDYAGNDYWEQERRVLNEYGATIEFFPYTEEQSSTRIRQSLESMNDLEAS